MITPNLLIDLLGGPQHVTAYLRRIGDPVTRLDRREPDLNLFDPTNPRDTTSPAAMLTTWEEMLRGDALPAAWGAQVMDWMSHDGVTGALIRGARRLVVQREDVAHLQVRRGLSERRACQIVGADRKMIRYSSQRAPDTALRTRLRDLATERRRFGYRRLFILARGRRASLRAWPVRRRAARPHPERGR